MYTVKETVAHGSGGVAQVGGDDVQVLELFLGRFVNDALLMKSTTCNSEPFEMSACATAGQPEQSPMQVKQQRRSTIHGRGRMGGNLRWPLQTLP